MFRMSPKRREVCQKAGVVHSLSTASLSRKAEASLDHRQWDLPRSEP